MKNNILIHALLAIRILEDPYIFWLAILLFVCIYIFHLYMVAVWKLHPYLAVTHVSIGRIMALRGPGSSCWARWRRYNGRDKSNVLRHCCLRCQWEIFFLQKAIIIAASFPRSVVDVVRWNVLIDPFECQFNYSISWGLTRWSAKKTTSR